MSRRGEPSPPRTGEHPTTNIERRTSNEKEPSPHPDPLPSHQNGSGEGKANGQHSNSEGRVAAAGSGDQCANFFGEFSPPRGRGRGGSRTRGSASLPRSFCCQQALPDRARHSERALWRCSASRATHHFRGGQGTARPTGFMVPRHAKRNKKGAPEKARPWKFQVRTRLMISCAGDNPPTPKASRCRRTGSAPTVRERE